MIGFSTPLPVQTMAVPADIHRHQSICMSAKEGGGRTSGPAPSRAAVMSRREMIFAAASLVAGAGVLTLPKSAQAGLGIEGAVSKVFFPKTGFNSPDKLVPGSVALDRDILQKPEAKEALTKLNAYSATAKDTLATFKSDPSTFDVAARFRTTMKIDDIRDSLNIVNEAFDENTQRYTDKVVRGIIQDIGEVITNAALKPGVARTPKKIERTTQWLVKITTDFDHLLAFYK